MATPTTMHLVLLPDLATGHLMSLIQAGIRISRHDASSRATIVTVLLVHPPTPASAAKVATQLQRVDSSVVRFHRLPPLDDGIMEAFPPDELPAFKSRYMQLYAPHVKAALAALRPAPAAVLLDFFATPVLDTLDSIPAYVYFTSSAAFLSLLLRLPTLHQELTLDFADMAEDVVDVPGIAAPVPAASMPAVLARRDNRTYDWFVYHGRRFPEADGIILNTVAELEPMVLDAISKVGAPPPLYPIGPVIDVSTTATATEGCVAWLDAQPVGSVVYLCFGSVGWLGPEQARELAAGLERSGHRFLWVLRGPPAPESGSNQLTDGEEAAKLLPAGFLDRTADWGMVWPSWAPQKDILAHAAVGAFVTHAGWNSCLESLWHGLPMVPWPLYAEQHLNAFQAVAEMGVAVALDGGAPPPAARKKLVEAAAVERAVRSVMGETNEGRTARQKAMEMKQYFRNAVDAGGSSHAAMQRLRDDIRRRNASTALNDC